MKIAIFHNFMDNIGGAEYVDLLLARELKADIYTTNIDIEKIKRLGFSTANIISIGKVPLNAPFRQEKAYWLFRRLDLGKKYDLYIIAGDWAMSGAVHNKPNFWYVYSPTREIWDLADYTRLNVVPWLLRPLYRLWVMLRRAIFRYDVRSVEQVISISKTVQERVKRYFSRESEVIYPPVETAKYKHHKNGDFWLSVNRLINHKRIEIQLKAFAQMPEEKLIIVGSYEKATHFKKYAKYLESIRPPNVEIRNWISSDELASLYADCRGFINTAYGEDFGLAPLEAMASGKPVIASNEGGFRETIIDGEHGILIDSIDEEKLRAALIGLSRDDLGSYRSSCQRQAGRFDLKRFIDQIRTAINLRSNQFYQING